MKAHDRTSILVAIPALETWKAEFGQCLLATMGHTAAALPDMRIEVQQSFGTLLPWMRNTLVKAALASGVTHIMWFDTDMTFPPDTIVRLLNRERPIVAANYCTRRPPFHPVAKDCHGQYVYTYPISTGLEEAAACGMGVMLVETSVFVAMSRPWFDVLTEDEGDVHDMGEDYWWAAKQHAEVGEPIWIDQDLSKAVGHVGGAIYDWTHALDDRVRHRLVKTGALDEVPWTERPHEKHRHLMDLEHRMSADEWQDLRKAFLGDLEEAEARKEKRLLGYAGMSEAAE